MNYIKELYFGNLNPSLQQYTKSSRYSKLTQEEAETYKELSKKLSDDNKKLLERISEVHSDINYITCFDNYTIGFRDGSRLMIDILLERDENLNSEK